MHIVVLVLLVWLVWQIAPLVFGGLGWLLAALAFTRPGRLFSLFILAIGILVFASLLRH